MGYGVVRLAAACHAAFLVVLLLGCCPRCAGRRLPPVSAEGRGGGEVVHFEGGLELSVFVRRGGGTGGPARPRRFSATGGAARLMRSVPSPGVGH
uniref:DUF3778 domain-containing protein n=1 Tax=Oryza brachyantha TaxID=4533 RepID=J3M946_ORYBR